MGVVLGRKSPVLVVLFEDSAMVIPELQSFEMSYLADLDMGSVRLQPGVTPHHFEPMPDRRNARRGSDLIRKTLLSALKRCWPKLPRSRSHAKRPRAGTDVARNSRFKKSKKRSSPNRSSGRRQRGR